MNIPLRSPLDRDTLDERIRVERNAKHRDRFRAVRLALDGQEAEVIAATLARSRRFVQRWAYAYRDGGLDGIAVKRQTGQPTKLPRDCEEAFKQRILAGPIEADGVCTLRGREALGILEKEFGVHYTLHGVYDLLQRLKLSCLQPRPRHRKNDPQAMQQWRTDAPLLSKTSAANIPAEASKSGSRTKPASANKAP